MLSEFSIRHARLAKQAVGTAASIVIGRSPAPPNRRCVEHQGDGSIRARRRSQIWARKSAIETRDPASRSAPAPPFRCTISSGFGTLTRTSGRMCDAVERCAGQARLVRRRPHGPRPASGHGRRRSGAPARQNARCAQYPERIRQVPPLSQECRTPPGPQPISTTRSPCLMPIFSNCASAIRGKVGDLTLQPHFFGFGPSKQARLRVVSWLVPSA